MPAHTIDPNSVPMQTLEWGAIKWLITPSNIDGAGISFGEVRLMPGQGHARHNHPTTEEVLYFLSGKGDQMIEEEGQEKWFPVAAGDCIYVHPGQFHSTINRGWEPLRLLAVYSPGGEEKALEALADFVEVAAGQKPSWRVERDAQPT